LDRNPNSFYSAFLALFIAFYSTSTALLQRLCSASTAPLQRFPRLRRLTPQMPALTMSAAMLLCAWLANDNSRAVLCQSYGSLSILLHSHWPCCRKRYMSVAFYSASTARAQSRIWYMSVALYSASTARVQRRIWYMSVAFYSASTARVQRRTWYMSVAVYSASTALVQRFYSTCTASYCV
jgi:hypothetical protein